MEKEFKIYTKTGDDGTTGLLGGSRVKKNDIRLEAYGTVDELNASLGFLRSLEINPDLAQFIIQIQHKLFNIGSVLASDEKGKNLTAGLVITSEDVEFLEKSIDKFETTLPPLTNFILPGGSPAAAYSHVCRTICRRAERRVLSFAEIAGVHPEIIQYLNRLSDWLFVLSRKINAENPAGEIEWQK